MRKIALLTAFIIALSAHAQHRSRNTQNSKNAQLVEHYQQYADSLQRVIDTYHYNDSVAKVTPHSVTMDPYCFPLFTPGTLYDNPLQQSFALNWQSAASGRKTGILALGSTTDERLTRVSNVYSHLSSAYITSPGLFTTTQKELRENGTLVTNVDLPIKSESKVSDQIKLVDIEHDVTDTIAAITRRPNFWTLKGSASLHFTQSYFSDNWFQGGDNNYAALSMITLEANYDNKQKLQWENKLEAQLGFQTTKGDTCHSMKVTSNLLRFTSKVGYKAWQNWYYTTRFQANTQAYPNYNTNSYNVTTDFASPLYLALSVGMDFKWNKKRFSGSLYIAPVEVNARYVDRKSLRSRYNDNEDQATKWTWGPNVVINSKWKIIDNIEWQSRLYWFTNFTYTNAEWENTFTFNVNKYINAKLFIYPKYIDDKKYGSKETKEDPNYSFFMFKEFLQLGLSYSW